MDDNNDNDPRKWAGAIYIALFFGYIMMLLRFHMIYGHAFGWDKIPLRAPWEW